jgi:tetratricopeptide (TPR) repeat protein/tRNA A-37 threonylcarbamoyl transferase component Bud32
VSDILAKLTAALAGRYALERELGAGGMATVYLAEDVRHRRKVAVKVLRPELAATLGPDRFLREIEIAAQLQHPHILPLLDSGEAEGFLYYVMPYIEGESLRDRLTRQRELPVPEATRLLRDVADALSYAHGRGVVHRDIKPDNVMLSGRHALVMDFGVAKAVSEATGRQSLTTVGVALGTPAYMAPEQAAADPHVDHRADIYALGAMGYELLTGRPPFTGLTPQQVLASHVTEAPKPVTQQRAACPPALAEVIMRCLAKRPADRWQSAEEVVERLEMLGTPSGGSTPAQTQPTMAVAAPDPWYGHPFRVAGLFLLASVAVLGVVYFLMIQLGLPDWVLRGAAVLLLLGLPVMIVTGVIERRRAAALATGMWSASGETGVQRLVTWRRATQGGMAAFSLLGVGTIVYTAMRLMGIGPVGTLVASGRLAERDKLIVADFANHSSDTTLGESVTEAFRIDIAQSPMVSVLGTSQVDNALSRMSRNPALALDPVTAREVALREGAKAVVVGEISPVGKGLVLSAKLQAAVDGTELVAVRETADEPGQILGAIDRLSKRMRERIGESLRSIRSNEPLAEVTTGSLEALRLYSEGARASDQGESDRAITLLQQAIALDSGFAMAWRKLAVAINNSRGSSTEAVAAATRAYQHRDRLTEVERYQTTAYYFFDVEYDLDKVISAYRAILELKPDDPIAPNNLALALNAKRRWSEAEPIARRWIEQGGSGNIYDKLIQSQLGQGKTREARETLKQYSRTDSTSAFRHIIGAGYYAAVGQYDSAMVQVDSMALKSRDPTDQSTVAAVSAALAVTRGKLAEGTRLMHDFEAVGLRRGLPQDVLTGAAVRARILAEYQGRPVEALRVLDEALAAHPLKSVAPLDRPYPQLATAYAIAGQPARGRALLQEYEAQVPHGVRGADAPGREAQGQVALAEGRTQDAITAFRAWWDNAGCGTCALADLGRAYDQAKQPDSTRALLQRAVENPRGLMSIYNQVWDQAPSLHRLGELYEDKGDKQRALDYYGRFVELWKDADPELQPQVRDAKERMAKLAGEQGR